MFKCSFVLADFIVTITFVLIFIGIIFPLIVNFFPPIVSCFSAIKLQHDVDLVIEPVDVASHSNSKLFI